MANNLGNKIEISHLTCPKDKRKETAREHTISVRSQSTNQAILTIYTDGSKTEKRTGAGYIAYHRNRTITKKEIGMGSQAEAFDTEKWALTKCIQWATKHADEHPQKQINTLKIYIDNAAIIKMVYEITPSSGQWIGKLIRKGIDEWLSKDERHRIRITWIPAHTGIRENEEVDKLVNAACSKPDKFQTSMRAYTL
jgi:ribonuclease HI